MASTSPVKNSSLRTKMTATLKRSTEKKVRKNSSNRTSRMSSSPNSSNAVSHQRTSLQAKVTFQKKNPTTARKEKKILLEI